MQDGTNIVQELREEELSGKLKNCPRNENTGPVDGKEEFVKKLFFADDILDDMWFNMCNCL
ncbi:MAG: hypothetical protein JXA91_03255 [Candidatus Thermoplasmatota archaeon]|nr:hypothetical protein [Candidatus Thermoplasmatota archaeon]